MKRGALICRFTAMLMTLFMVNITVLADSNSVSQDAKAMEVLNEMDAYMDSLDKFVIKADED